jgi:N-acetylmuramoyl-L-alanine amidase
MATPGAIVVAAGAGILSLAQQHVGEAYYIGALVPKNNPSWKGKWNCSEFASWLVFQVAGFLYGCDRDSGDPATAHAYTGYWNRDATNLGQIIPIDQAAQTPGANVLRLPTQKETGHIVISDGTGGTVEAHSHLDGVIRDTLHNRRWDMGILVPGIGYSQGPPMVVTPPATTIYRLTTPPMTGSKVQEIQQALRDARFDPGAIDGVFGPHTLAAVVSFQESQGLVVDGEVGPRTAQALNVQL